MRHNPACQILATHGKTYMFDCGEGAQLQMRRQHFSHQRLRAIFITHLHGDHCFGLMGLLSSMSLQGRVAPIDIYAPSPLKEIFQPLINFHASGAQFDIRLHEIPHTTSETIYTDNSVSVTTIPLRHRLPCTGYLIRENPRLPHIRRDIIDRLSIPLHAIAAIKQGAGWQTPDGRRFAHSQLVLPPRAPRSYAYISDTIYDTTIAAHLRGVSLLYHEATFAQADAAKAQAVMHTTAAQAAHIARRAHARQLLLGHYSARYDDETQLLCEAKTIFPNTILAQEGLAIEIE